MKKDRMRQLAKRLVKDHLASEPSIQEVLWFPHEEELRLVEVVSDTVKSDSVMAFHFGPDVAGGIPSICSHRTLIRSLEFLTQ